MKGTDQAIQRSVVLAMLWGLAITMPLSLLGYALSGEWLRVQRTLMLLVFLLPIAFWCWRQADLQPRRAMRVLALCAWLGLSLQLITAGTLAHPLPPILVILASTGILARDPLLTRLLPLLIVATLLIVGLGGQQGWLAVRVPPSQSAMLVGCLLALVYLVSLMRISRHYLRLAREREALQARDLEQLSAELQLAIQAGGISRFSLDADRLRLDLPADTARLLGCAPGEVALAELRAVGEEDRRLIRQLASAAQSPAVPLLLQLQAGPAAGRWFRLYSLRGQQTPERLICALQDVHELRQAELAKENFTAMVSHELRTPLTAMLGALRLLQGLHLQQLDADAQRLLLLAQRGGERLAQLVNEVLDYSRLQAGRLPLDCGLHPLQPMIAASLDAVSPLLAEKRLRVEQASWPQLSLWMDSPRAERVLINLLSNAIRFSPPGATLHLELVEGAEQVALRLRDEGPGVAPTFVPQLFQPFSQANTGNTHDNQSTGLGLAISQQLMRQMHGELRYLGDAAAGATFEMSFRRAAPPAD